MMVVIVMVSGLGDVVDDGDISIAVIVFFCYRC